MVRTPWAVATMISSPSWRASRDFLAPLASTTVAEEGKQGSPSPRSADGGGEAETVGDGVEAETVGDGVEAETVGDGVEAETVGDGVEAKTVGDGVEAKTVGDGVEAETVSDASTSGAAVPSAVAKMATVSKQGLHSPVMTNGHFPLVDGIVTAFDSINMVTVAGYGIPILEATATIELFKRVAFDSQRKFLSKIYVTDPSVTPEGDHEGDGNQHTCRCPCREMSVAIGTRILSRLTEVRQDLPGCRLGTPRRVFVGSGGATRG